MTTIDDTLEGAALVTDPFEVRVGAARTLSLHGQIASRDPVAELGPHFRAVHDAAAGGGDVTLDLTALTFVNSSGLRLFIDWIGWILSEPDARRYRLRVRTKKGVTWQAAAFPAIAMLGGAQVLVEPSP